MNRLVTRTKRGRLKQILSGRVHPELAEEIAARLKIPLSNVELADFANGEISVRVKESLRGNDVFIIQAHYGSINRAIIEQLIMIDAAKRASARSITAVCPFLGYARQDRKSGGREPIAARLIIDMLTAAGADRIMSVDLHSGQIQGFYDGPFDHLIAMPIFKKYIRENFSDDVVFVAPDAGRVKLTERYSSSMGTEMAIIHKTRSVTERNSVEAKHLIGKVEGRDCVIIDDMIDTAGTFCAAADMLKEKGAKSVVGLATHGIFSEPALNRIKNSAFERIVITNTLPAREGDSGGKIVRLSIAPLIADAINAIFEDESLSALFEDANQA